jgi:ribosomal protein S18 acetylase RimI-like enzyme
MGGRHELGGHGIWDLLERTLAVEVAGVVAGRPVLRSLHHGVMDHTLVFHGGRKGAKWDLLGTEVVVQATEVVARIPSFWRHPERACPATTYYRSVQLEGRLVAIDDVAVKARALEVLMQRLQGEGGYRPITHDDPLYRSAVRSLVVAQLEAERTTGVAKLGQERSVAEIGAILTGLWTRGGPGDLAGIEAIAEAHPDRPAFVDVGTLRPRCHARPADVAAAVALVTDEYWNRESSDGVLAGALRACAWVGLERDGRLVATARAASDRFKRSFLFDVAVAPDCRGGGVGAALMRLMLDHPAVRDTEMRLGTRDAMGFYERFGFSTVRTVDTGLAARSEMVRLTS